MSVESDIGSRIATRREAAGLTQTALGEAIGSQLDKPWPRQAVSAAEKGRRSFTAAELLALAASLHCGVSDLLGTTDAVSPVDAARLRFQIALAEVRRMQAYLRTREDSLIELLGTG